MDRVIGIDVSKARLDVFTGGQRLAVANNEAGIAAMVEQLGLCAGDLLVMEASGGYERLAQRRLGALGLAAAVVNPKRVRDFAKASGRLAKTDRVDAEVIARYGAFARPAPTPAPDPVARELAELLAFRQRLIGEITSRHQQLGHLATPRLRARAQADLDRLRRDKAEIEALLRQVVMAAPHLKRAFGLLTSMPGVGLILAATMLAGLPELGSLDRRKIASPVGVAPIARDSGLRRGQRVVAEGRSAVRRVLYMAALSTSRSDSRFAAFYRRLIANGKPPKLALVATMRKMTLVRLTLAPCRMNTHHNGC